ncbi:MAG: hypothetical protein NXI10_13260 [bacterium]|nr:hypothetical protein [bacterium]
MKELFAIVGSAMVLLWLFTVSTFGQLQLIRDNLPSSNIKIFKIIFATAPCFILLNILISEWLLDRNNTFGVVTFVLLVLGTILSVFYLYYFTAKTITTIENRREVSLQECYNNLVLIGLSGVGIFILQPKIQRLIEADNTK